MNWASITIVFIQILGLGIAMGKHRQEEFVTHNFWDNLIAFVISMILYYYAGIFG